MQLIPVYLYPNSITAYTSSSLIKERYRRVYNRTVKIYKSTDNIIDIQVKNSDQKPLNISGKYFVFNLFNQETGRLITSKDCVITSNSVGRLQVNFTERELYSLENGFYNYSILEESRSFTDDNSEDSYSVISERPLYVDDQYGAVATIEIVGDVLGNLKPTTVIREFSYTNPRSLGEPEILYFTSGIIDARPSTTDPQTLHTFQIYFREYTGMVSIEASLDEGGTPHNWFEIPSTAISPGANNFNTEGANVIYKNVIGRYNWFRIRQVGGRGNGAAFRVNQTNLGIYEVAVKESGIGYSVGEAFNINGGRLGGDSVNNDLLITITEINETGAITEIEFSGTSIPGFRTFTIDPIEKTEGNIDKILYR
jgi:hypothetical protein